MKTQKYLCTNLETREEFLCEKVEIEGFDYYVSNKIPIDDEYWTYIGNNEPIEITKNNLPKEWYEKLHDKVNYFTVITTTNLSLDIPKVVDEVGFICKKLTDLKAKNNSFIDLYVYSLGIEKGFLKAKEEFKWTDKDMLDFGRYCFNDAHSINRIKTFEQLLELWQSKQPIKIYFK